ncbi:hypothetical protein [Microbacterium gorillae]|uniref:hypothetical protein n=1 Tax=Microbacterium gorillae TaxID=1231063 RepID=UPI003D99AE33
MTMSDMPSDGFEHPNPTITDLDLAFPARGADPDVLPPMSIIPDRYDGKEDWDAFHRAWFYTGLPETVQLDVRAGIDPRQAWNHLRVVQGCYGSKHEHKMAALAWLSSRWFAGYQL